MKISKTKYFNYIRCHRYVALEELTYQRNQAIISFDESLEDLYTQELKDKQDELLHNLYESMHYSEHDFEEDVDFDPLQDDTKNALFRLLQPQYEQIEKLSAEKVQHVFGGSVIYSKETYQQKYIKKEVDGFHFFAFVDAYQEDQETVRIIETKASTSKKFANLGYKKDGEQFLIFTEDEHGIYHLNKALNDPADQEKFTTQYQKLLDKYDSLGRYVYDIAYQRYLDEYQKLGNKQRRYYLALLNHNFIYDGKKSIDGSAIYSADQIIRLIDLTEVTHDLLPIIDDEIKQIINRLNQMQASPVPVGVYCQKGKAARECPFLSVCLKDKGVPEKNSLFVYRNTQYPFVENRDRKNKMQHPIYDLINEGIVHALEVPRDWLSHVQKMQFDAIQTETPYIQFEKIRKGIQSLKYPLYHLDFESFSSPLPRYAGEKAYQQSLFQFSLHIEHKDQKVDKDKNFYYLADSHEDPREKLVQKLIECIPMDGGHVVVYNKSFESGRIKELIQLFPKYEKHLQNIQERIFDLLYLVRGNKEFYEELGFGKEKEALPVYYDQAFQRSYSIKQVLPVLVPELDYKNLEEVQNGQQAQIAYYQLPFMTEEDQKTTIFNMLEYCKHDTWAMVEILRRHIDLVKDTSS